MKFLNLAYVDEFWNNEPKGNLVPFNLPFYKTIESDLDFDVVNSSLYALCHEARSPQKINRGFVRAIQELVMSDLCSHKLKNFASRGFRKDGTYMAVYYNGKAENFNDLLEGHIVNNLVVDEVNLPAERVQVFEIKEGIMSAVVIDEDGNKSNLTIKQKGDRYSKGKHSPSGVIYALTGYVIDRIRDGIVCKGDPGYDVSKIIYTHYDGLKASLLSNDTYMATSYTMALANDLYELFAFEKNVKDKFITLPIDKIGMDKIDYPTLTELNFDMKFVSGHSSIMSGEIKIESVGGYVEEDDYGKTLGEIVNSPYWSRKYQLDPERVLTPFEQEHVPTQHDDKIVPREVLIAAKIIKATRGTKYPQVNALFTGVAGTGKTVAVQMLARLLGLPYNFQAFHPDMTVQELLSELIPDTKQYSITEKFTEYVKNVPSISDMALRPDDCYYTITGIHKADATEEDCKLAVLKAFADTVSTSGFTTVDSPTYIGIKFGWVIEWQEPNNVSKQGVLTGVNSVMDGLGTAHTITGETIHRHKDSIIVLTANVDYEGTKRINQSVKSRCGIKIHFELPEDDRLLKMIKQQSGYKEDAVIKKMIQTMKALNKVLMDNGADDGCCSVRELISWAQCTDALKDPYEAAMYSIIPSCTDDEEVIEECISALQLDFAPKAKKKAVRL